MSLELTWTLNEIGSYMYFHFSKINKEVNRVTKVIHLFQKMQFAFLKSEQFYQEAL